MVTGFVILGGIILWAMAFVLIDEISYRRDRRARRR
jgi:hypothetical protein